MILFKKAADLTQHLIQQKISGKKTGFVPTMGALHQGHISLIETSRKNNDLTVCSVFVNPTQFTNSDDFTHYPKTIEKDIEALISAGCDILFLPSVNEIYPADYNAPKYDLGYLEMVLEGQYRPGHFQGVCQVVDRLLQIVTPENLYLGQKDFQQCKVIQRLIDIIEQIKSVKLYIAPTLREKDGLAMSSRNLRLSEEERNTAPVIYHELKKAQLAIQSQTVESVEQQAKQNLEQAGFKVDYFTLVDKDTLQPSRHKENLVALTAANLGSIRLIDNLPLN